MLLNYEWLIRDGVIKELYSSVLLQIYKESQREYHTTWLMRCGILSAEQLIEYLNKIPENTLRYIIPQLEEGDTYIDMDTLIDSSQIKLTFAKVCEKYRLFPYKIEGRTLVWLAEERDDYTSEGYPTKDEVYDYATTLATKFKESKKDFFENRVEYTIRPLFEEELRKYSIQNKLPYNSGDVYRIKPEFLTKYYIVKGIDLKASDIFFDPKINGVLVSYSILNDYMIDDMLLLDNEDKKRFCEEILVLTGIQPKSRPETVVVDSSIKNLGEVNYQYNGRVNLFKNMGFDACCIRIVDKSKKAIPFDKLNLRKRGKDAIERLLYNAAGVILFAGSTGSGKSTTISSTLTKEQEIDPYRRIETVEDPIEQVMDTISQLSLENSDATYDDVAHALTRRNPSVLYIGELNTPKTVEFATNAALKNLLILSTIHGIDAKSIPDRIRGMTVENPSIYEQMLQVLRGIVHQTMLKKACPDCLQLIPRTDPRITNDMDTVLNYYGYIEDYVPIACPKPNCSKCQGRGFLINEPIIAVEVAVIDDSLQEDILAAPKTSIGKIIYEDMRRQKLTGVHDALDYMREQEVDWMQIWKRFSLYNKVRSCVQPGDANENQGGFNPVQKN